LRNLVHFEGGFTNPACHKPYWSPFFRKTNFDFCEMQKVAMFVRLMALYKEKNDGL